MPSGGPSQGKLGSLKPLLASLAEKRLFPLIVAALGVFLALPALRAGWIQDDYYHRAVMLPDSPYRELLGPPAEMFRFFRGDPVRTGRIVDIGVFPWWTDLTLKAEFLQALTVLTHRLDYALWPDSPALMHAQNLFWLGTMLAAVAVFYRRMFGPTWVAAVAAILYAVDDARGAVAGFIANRNILIAATFGVSAFVFHDRWRRDGSRYWPFLRFALLGAALFSKEEGIGTCAYLGRVRPVRRPGRTVARVSGIAAVWRSWSWAGGLVRGYWHYGVANMGLYVDPLTDPLPFAAAVVRHVPLLLLGQWSPVPAETAILFWPP